MWRIVSYNFFGPKKLGETGSQNVTIDVGHGNLHFSHPSPQLLHLLARFGKGIPEGDSLHVFLQAFGNLPCSYCTYIFYSPMAPKNCSITFFTSNSIIVKLHFSPPYPRKIIIRHFSVPPGLRGRGFAIINFFAGAVTHKCLYTQFFFFTRSLLISFTQRKSLAHIS